MRHHRSPAQSYPHPHGTPDVHLPVHATLALRHANPTLLSPLRYIANVPLAPPDDFQSNAWANDPAYRPPLAGLGITCLRDASLTPRDPPLAIEDFSLRMHIDGVDSLFSLPAEPCLVEMPLDDFPAPTVAHRGFESHEIRRVAQFTPEFAPSPYDESTNRRVLDFDSDIDPTAGDIIGLIPDVNMYDTIRRLDLPRPGVNPLDTIHSTAFRDIGISYGDATSPTPRDHHIGDVLSATDARAEQSPSPRVIRDIMSILVQPAPKFPSQSRSSANSPSAQNSSTSVKLEPTNVSDGNHRPVPAPCTLAFSNTTKLSPVLNAHLGIELNELISRAERFKTRYPERDIDRAWLSHFAGKLSNRGELLDDFRCYVIGCDQRNKRRDHILVHVGAHIGQRPFACSICPLRFLRKNECKRHEASHSGFRPYTCDICGQSFVRQDLVKRHVKRTHGVRDENDSGVGKPSRKKTRLV